MTAYRVISWEKHESHLTTNALFAESMFFPNMEELIQCHKAPEPLKSKDSQRSSQSADVLFFIILSLFLG